ncbi:P-loop NTPase family protein [Roseivivax sediminis]|uniref:Uncharacterized protein n=1 Tax=Roseivivax sediminis TaxID=936889 RepID=A0A1I1VRY2_9RHOB|nr:ParA family protein [Roseivivax sediminis]SFD83783.1 hypothetical protein SAMN04515678_103275 [Roseivivax sediminis]
MSIRGFDFFLTRLNNARSRRVKAGGTDYDFGGPDCPTAVSTLSENIFRASDAIFGPVVPTAPSAGRFERLFGFFTETKHSGGKDARPLFVEAGLEDTAPCAGGRFARWSAAARPREALWRDLMART